MHTKHLVMIVAVAVGATAVGGLLLWERGGQEQPGAPLAPGAVAGRASQPDYFAQTAVESTPSRDEISTAGRSGAGTGADGGMWDQLLSRLDEFDADGDGILSGEEREAMRRAIRDEMMAKMDLDGDGEISRDERIAARQKRFEQSPWGQDLMREFDADGNGVLDDDEQAAMESRMEAQRAQRRQEQLARWDRDGDGELSGDERRAQRDQMGDRRDRSMQEMTAEFDHDGDGRLSIEESREAWATMQERREIDGFIRRYDRDGNGSLGGSDYDAFLSDYSRGDIRADVNRDGEINSMDVAAYTDMVTRSRSRP